MCLEGKISQASAMRSLSAGHQPSGDQIPWKFCEQFQDKEFPTLSGARIVRIATHPNAMKVCVLCTYHNIFFQYLSLITILNDSCLICYLQLGYGSAAIELLSRYLLLINMFIFWYFHIYPFSLIT